MPARPLAGLTMALLLAAAPARSWTANDELPIPNYSDSFSPALVLPAGEVPRIGEIKFPVHGRPSLLRPGDSLRVVLDVDQDPASTNLFLVRLRLRSHDGPIRRTIDLTGDGVVTEDPVNDVFLIEAPIPGSNVPYDLYDLEIETRTGAPGPPANCANPPAGYTCDTQTAAVKVLDRFRDDYTFVHLSDVHQDDPRGTGTGYPQDVMDGIIKTLNFVQPEFVVISGDLATGNSYQDELPKSVRTFDAANFPTFAVPGNHDAQRNVAIFNINDGYDYYRAFWGPPYYSFDYGPLHFVAVDSMDRPRADREIGFNQSGLLAEFFGGIDLRQANGGALPHSQVDWLESDLTSAQSAGKSSLLFLHHDPTKDFTPGLESHDVWNFEDPEYAESSDRIREMLGRFDIPFVLVGHDHYDEVRDVLGTTFVMTTTAASERRFGSYWGYRLFRVQDGQVKSFNYLNSPSSVPYGFAEDANDPDTLTPNLDWYFVGPNDGTAASESAIIRNSLSEPITGRLRFFVSDSGNQASRGAMIQQSAFGSAVRALVEVTVPAGQTIQVRVGPATAPPPPPGNLTGTVRKNSIRLRWDPVLDTDVRGYRVSVRPTGGTATLHDVLLDQLPSPEHPSFEVGGLTTGIAHVVDVSALDASGNGAASRIVLTPHQPPAAPTNLRAVAGNQRIDLSFGATAGATAWMVYYGSGAGQDFFGTEAAEGASPIRVITNQVRLSGLENGTEVHISVTAVDGTKGESAFAPTVRVIPEAFATGDIDEDGVTDAADRNALLRTQAGLAAIDSNLPNTGDLNGNSHVDLGDAALADALVRGRNTAPVVHAELTPPVLTPGGTVTVDASQTVDREDLPSALQFRFDFDGSGSFTPWGPSPVASHVYPTAQARQVVIESRDSAGLAGRAVVQYLPKIATHLFLVDIDGCRRDVFYRWISGSSGHRALRDDILGTVTFGGTNSTNASFATSSSVGSNFCRALFPTVTFTNQAAIPMGQHARIHGIAGNEFFDRDLLFERSFVSGDSQAVYTEGKALATLWPGARSIYEDGTKHGLQSAVIFHQYPKGAGSYVSQTTPEFGAFLLDPAQKYDQLSFYRSVQELTSKSFPPIAYIYLAGLDHRSHLEGIESQDDHISVLDTFFETFVHGGNFEYPDITVPTASLPPIAFAGLEHLPDPATADPNDSLLDNSIFCFTADHGQINYGDEITEVSDITEALQEYGYLDPDDPNAVVERQPEQPEPRTVEEFWAAYGSGERRAASGERAPGAPRKPRTGLKDPETLAAATVVAEFNGPSMFLYVKNRARGTWEGYPDFNADVLPLVRALAKANVDGDNSSLVDGAIQDIVVRRTGKAGTREYSEGYVGYRWDGHQDQLIELEDFFTPTLVHDTNIIEHLRALESRRSGDIILTSGRDAGADDTERTGSNFGIPFISVSDGQHGNWTQGESLIPQVCGGRPVARLGLQHTEPLTSQVDFAPTAAQFLGVPMPAADGKGYLYSFGEPPRRYPQAAAVLGSGSGTPGRTVETTVRVNGGAGLSALRARFRFDRTRLTLLGAGPSSVGLVDAAIHPRQGAAEVAVLFEPLAIGNTVAFTLRWRIERAAGPGLLSITMEGAEVADPSGYVQPVGSTGGIVTVLPAPPVPSDPSAPWRSASILVVLGVAGLLARRRIQAASDGT